MSRTHTKLPVGPNPGWELDETDEDGMDVDVKSVSESCVILQSLRQSRERWLSMFPKFSSKSRGGKHPGPTPPPHTIQTRGRCDLHIGPHTFTNTVLYEVHYLPVQQPPPPSGQSMSNSMPSTSSWQATTAYGGSYVPFGQKPFGGTLPTPLNVFPPPPPLPSLASPTTITPTLINQVNSAASSNPILANLLQLAAASRATPDQLKTLGLLIQSLALSESHNMMIPAPTSAGPGPYAQTTYVQPVKEFDIVIEFAERPTERWIFPRGPALCERLLDSRSKDAAYDVIVTTCVPFPGTPHLPPGPTIASADPEKVGPGEKPAPQIATFRLEKAPIAVWDTISRWVGGEEKMNLNRPIIDQAKKSGRVYLGYQLPEGSLLSQLQNATALSYTMKSLKPGPAIVPRPKRKPAPRKSVAGGSESRTAPTGNPEASAAEDATPPAKRRRISQAKAIPIAEISCQSCGQTDVPLILGGRFCRPCVDSGKTTITVLKHKLPAKTQTTEPPPTPPNLQQISTPPQTVKSPLGMDTGTLPMADTPATATPAMQ